MCTFWWRPGHQMQEALMSHLLQQPLLSRLANCLHTPYPLPISSTTFRTHTGLKETALFPSQPSPLPFIPPPSTHRALLPLPPQQTESLHHPSNNKAPTSSVFKLHTTASQAFIACERWAVRCGHLGGRFYRTVSQHPSLEPFPLGSGSHGDYDG